MKTKMISFIAVMTIGLLVTVMTISSYAAVEKEYNTNIASARRNAEKQIPYNAYNYYQKAFEIRCEDEAVFKEYLEQAKLLGTDFYEAAIEEYVTRFPGSPEANELLCGMYYEHGSFTLLLDAALLARERNAATEQIKDWYNECAYMLKTLSNGYEEAYSFLGDVALVKVNGNYGFVNTNGDSMLPPIYSGASPMMGANAAVNDGEEWHIINRGGFKVARTSSPVDYMGILVGGKIPIGKDGKYAYTNTGLQIPEELPYDYASNFKNGVAAVKKGERWALIDIEENLITDHIFEDVILDEFNTCHNAGVIFVKKDGKYYMVNASGQKITETAFDNAKPFVTAEPAAVCVGGKWGFVDSSGNWVMEPQFEDADSYSLGLAGICKDGLWGYINKSGKLMIDHQFEDCLPFTSIGITAVKENEIWKYVQLLPYHK